MASNTLPAHSLCLRHQDLAGKVAVVTGGSRGIGRAIVLNLASRGCSVIATCSSPESIHLIDTLRHTIESLYNTSGATSPRTTPKILGIAANLFEDGTPAAIAKAVQGFEGGRLDILVNSAAWATALSIGELTDEHIHGNLKANIEIPVKIVEELVKGKLFRPNSRIVGISSVRARKAWSHQIMYMACKSAQEAMIRSWAQAFGGKNEQFAFMAGTTANCVMVGLTNTDAVYNNNIPEDILRTLENEFVPMQGVPRIGQPEDVADVVGLLCREESRWITGSVVSADGGSVSIL